MAVLCSLCLWHWGKLPPPLGPILTCNEIGMGRTLIAGSIPDRPWLVWCHGLALAVSLSGAVVLVAALVDGLGHWKHWIRCPATGLVLNGLGQLLLLEGLWLFYDRYYLTLLPGGISLLVGYLKLTKSMSVLILAGGLLWEAIAVTGTIDMFRFNVAVLEARTWLVRQGVDPGHIDAGYALNGWWLYAPHLRSGLGPEPDVPFVTTMTSLPYKIANALETGYAVARRVTWPAFWAASNTIYVLEHAALIEQRGLPHLLPKEER
jgi:hypothetical protein